MVKTQFKTLYSVPFSTSALYSSKLYSYPLEEEYIHRHLILTTTLGNKHMYSASTPEEVSIAEWLKQT
jgi:hypothetical protein